MHLLKCVVAMTAPNEVSIIVQCMAKHLHSQLSEVNIMMDEW